MKTALDLQKRYLVFINRDKVSSLRSVCLWNCGFAYYEQQAVPRILSRVLGVLATLSSLHPGPQWYWELRR